MAEYLKQLQETQLSMLKDITSVCEKYKITYYLSCGTLLGAIRHKGFIPWDDDVDISMPMDDYVRFLEIAQEALGDAYFLQTPDTDNCYYRGYAKICLNNTTMMHKQHRKWKSHQGIYIDIFPVIKINSKFELLVKRVFFSLSNYVIMDNFLFANYNEFYDKLGKFGMALVRTFYRIPFQLRKKWHKNILRCICNGKGSRYASLVWAGLSGPYTQSACIGEPKLVEFEGLRLCTFPDPVRFLEEEFGLWNVLPPLEQRIGHGDLIVDFEKSYTEYLEDK